MPDLGGRFAAGGPAPRRATRTGTRTRCTTSTGDWRGVTDAYAGERAFVGEVWVATPERAGPLPAPRRAAHRVQLRLPARAVGRRRRCATAIDESIERARRGRRAPDLGAVEPRRHPPRDPLRRRRRSGTRRARAAALLMLALPGGAYVYQGEELGLPEVARPARRAAPGPDVPAAPAARSAAATGAGCRCRGPATRRRSASAAGRRRGCPSRPSGPTLTAERQEDDPASMLCAVPRRAARAPRAPGARRRHDDVARRRRDDVLAFRRSPGFACVVNLGERPLDVTDVGLDGAEVLLASVPLGRDDAVPPTSTVWFAVDG